MILNAIIDDPSITRIQLSTTLGLSEATVGRSIKTLKDNGLIRRAGSTRKRDWEIIK